MTITPKTLFRAAGVAAAIAGLIFIGVQINLPTWTPPRSPPPMR
jgi:hypothetical protein